MRVDDRSHHTHVTEIGGRKEDKDGSSQNSKKWQGTGKAVTPDVKLAKKMRVSGDSNSSMESSREKRQSDGGSNDSEKMYVSSYKETDSSGHGNVPGGNQI